MLRSLRSLLACSLAAGNSIASAADDPGESIYLSTCSGCHGTVTGAGRAPTLFDPGILAARGDALLHERVLGGIERTEMPAFKGVLSDTQVDQVIAYLHATSTKLKANPPPPPRPGNRVFHTEKQAFRIEIITDQLEVPWGLVFLPDGRMLVTERPGRLRILDRHGKLLPKPVSGTPKVWERQDGGMLDIALHPDHVHNGWIYLSYSEVAPGHVVTAEEAGPSTKVPRPSPPSMTVMIRGKLSADGAWTQSEEIFRAPAELYTSNGSHYGSRFVFDRQGYLYYSIGERGDMTNAQRLDSPLGKIHRVRDDGSVPPDNPFVNTPGAIPTIWSYGHRNPEGLAFDPVTGLLWESEHGPRDGDEINIIEKGHNYGWGVASKGIQPGITKLSEPGMDDPVAWYVPGIAPSGIGFYTGKRYPGWNGNLLVTGLRGQQLRRLQVEGRTVTHQEILYEKYGRVRAVKTGPDGLIYVLMQNPTSGLTGIGLTDSTPGMLVRLRPVR
jgi:glucose/arabinose dehydrogenase